MSMSVTVVSNNTLAAKQNATSTSKGSHRCSNRASGGLFLVPTLVKDRDTLIEQSVTLKHTK